jgi:hypothetical protein
MLGACAQGVTYSAKFVCVSAVYKGVVLQVEHTYSVHAP